jgi:hypothetical protein
MQICFILTIFEDRGQAFWRDFNRIEKSFLVIVHTIYLALVKIAGTF